MISILELAFLLLAVSCNSMQSKDYRDRFVGVMPTFDSQKQPFEIEPMELLRLQASIVGELKLNSFWIT